ncbi:hypothetical protein F0U60_46025 [Archangium minus]|uniref:Flp pilus-assembly TadG-like N-terminal domain-containing protein n=1 Tax=Archangium minus TaxID=83450 RepID=A0ABY9X5J5_9BACT|nr:hypothetical protein F0U61_46155 [Archangium violaceum]WNG50673.1 hypothetical protein F0U60_46025 [Archangium minus]
MPHHQPLLKRSRRGAPRGQALVLAALSLLLLGLMVALSFSVSHALRGKTRLQQHSDAMAYSMAVVEARSLNYFAVSNRAIAASFVAMNSLHAYMAAGTVTSAMLDQGKTNFEWITAQEALLCLPCPWKSSACKHCKHAVKAYKISKKFNNKRKEYDKEIKSVEKSFDNAVQALDAMIDIIHMSQQTVFAQTSSLLSNGTANQMSLIKEINAKEASNVSSAVGGLNVAEFSCAIDGMPCSVSGKPGNTARTARAKVMTEVANATRPEWPATRGRGVAEYLHPDFLEDLMHGIQGSGESLVTGHDGTAKTVQSASTSAVEQGQVSNNEGKVSGADEHGRLSSTWEDGFWTGRYEASIFSGKDSNGHSPGSAHSGGKHNKFEGVYSKDLMACAAGGNCFMKFRADPDNTRDFGQPHVYSYVTMKMRKGDWKNETPWELNSQSELKFTHGQMGTAQIKMAPDEGAAISNALVYYHRLGDWQEQPNMFNPFWRAKLHPFTGNQAATVLSAAGNTDAAQLAKSASDLPL